MSQHTINICWITSSYLLDVDIPIVPALQNNYKIDWIILTNLANYEGDKKLIESTGCNEYHLITNENKFISPVKIYFYIKLLNNVKNKNYSLIYFDVMGMPYLFPLVQMILPKVKIIIAAHNVKTPKGARYYWLAKTYMDYVVKTFNNFQVFSKNQLDLLMSIKKNANLLYAPLCLKYYGEPTVRKPTDVVTFLCFGNIVEYKRVDVLLNAVKILENNNIRNFKVKIAGYCRLNKWEEYYKPLITDSGNVECDIRRIPNDAIPDLFESCHYFVMPYQDIAQSGAMTVALCYNIPIIASELETFKEFLNDGKDGYFFEVGNAAKLAERMQFVIEHHNEIYDELRKNQAKLVEEKLSTDVILNMYRKYLNSLCQF